MRGNLFNMRLSPTPWFVATIAFVVLGFSRGIHSSFGVFNVALLDTFGWSRGATAGIFSIVLSVDAVLSPLVGHLLDRYGTKKISIAGCITLVAGLLLSSQVSALWQLYISFGHYPRGRFYLQWHGAAYIFDLRMVFVESGIGNRFCLCRHRPGHHATGAAE